MIGAPSKIYSVHSFANLLSCTVSINQGPHSHPDMNHARDLRPDVGVTTCVTLTWSHKAAAHHKTNGYRTFWKHIHKSILLTIKTIYVYVYFIRLTLAYLDLTGSQEVHVLLSYIYLDICLGSPHTHALVVAILPIFPWSEPPSLSPGSITFVPFPRRGALNNYAVHFSRFFLVMNKPGAAKSYQIILTIHYSWRSGQTCQGSPKGKTLLVWELGWRYNVKSKEWRELCMNQRKCRSMTHDSDNT